jgi:glycerol-3-phosphate dehydrogenase subunit C
VVRVLERNGARVTFPKQGCCGLPLVSNGDFDAGRSYATRLVRHLRGAADDPGVIVASSTSCGMTLKAKYRELLGLDDADTRAVSQAVYDICEYLVGLDDDGRSTAPSPPSGRGPCTTRPAS